MLKGRDGRKRARTQPAKDVAEALGTAAGVHPLIPRRGRPQQTCGCQDAPIQTWNHQPPHGHMKTEEKYVYAFRHTHTHTRTPLTGPTQMFP